MRPLHLFTPVRIDYLLRTARHAGLTDKAGRLEKIAKFWILAAAAACWQSLLRGLGQNLPPLMPLKGLSQLQQPMQASKIW